MTQPAGNHGIVIPRDKRLLTRMYWKDEMSLPEMGVFFDVTHKSVERVMRELGIPRRKVGHSRHTKCIECGKPVYKTKHAGNGAEYGKRCLEHKRKHYRELSREYLKNPEIREKVLKRNYSNYYRGPKCPKGEKQWLSRSRVLLRNAKRLSLGQKTRVASKFPTLVSKLVRSSQV